MRKHLMHQWVASGNIAQFKHAYANGFRFNYKRVGILDNIIYSLPSNEICVEFLKVMFEYKDSYVINHIDRIFMLCATLVFPDNKEMVVLNFLLSNGAKWDFNDPEIEAFNDGLEHHPKENVKKFIKNIILQQSRLDKLAAIRKTQKRLK